MARVNKWSDSGPIKMKSLNHRIIESNFYASTHQSPKVSDTRICPCHEISTSADERLEGIEVRKGNVCELDVWRVSRLSFRWKNKIVLELCRCNLKTNHHNQISIDEGKKVRFCELFIGNIILLWSTKHFGSYVFRQYPMIASNKNHLDEILHDWGE